MRPRFAIAAFFTVLFFAFAANSALAEDDPQTRFSRAGELYMQDKPEEAAALYQTLLDEGYSGTELHYNAATAYLRAGKAGEAAWNFERALLWEPDCADCKTNYDKLRELQKDKVVLEANAAETKDSVTDAFLSSVSLGTLTALFTLFWIPFIAALIAVRFVRRERLRVALVLIAVTAFLGVLGSAALREIKLTEYENVVRAVVMNPEVAVRKGPNTNFDTAFTVHEGLVVRLGESMEDWRQIFLENGLHGFVPQESLKKI